MTELRLSMAGVDDKSFRIIIYGFETNELQYVISSHINGQERTNIVNNILLNILNYLTQILVFNDEKIYIFAENKFHLMRRFKF